MSITPTSHLHSLWAKAADGGTAGPQRHPVLWHLLDVAAMAEVLWDGYVSPSFRERFQRSLALSDPRQARAWFSWLAAMHDLGKVSPFFQGQADHCATLVQEQGLTVRSREVDHEIVGALLVRDRLRAYGIPAPTANAWATAANISHGRVLGSGEIRAWVGHARAPGHPEYAALVDETVALVREVVGAVEDLSPDVGADAPLLAEAAGAIKACDWIASNEKVFPYLDVHMDAQKYMARARNLARSARWTHWLLGWRTPQGSMSFGDQFEIETPHPLQLDADRIAADLPLGSITIIEAPMGQGKTEAALAMAHRFAGNGASGLYFALPTQATARTMHERVAAWLKRTGLSTRAPILNSGDWAVEPPRDVIEGEGFERPDQDGQQGAARTEPSKWFRGPHRALLAKVGVGTVDQVLLSAQPVRYAVARWAGLAGRVVVFDEVHAYDAFMNTLFERALMWLSRMGCPVIILSATLPSGTRQRMLDAYRSGLLGENVSEPVQAEAYPCITTGTAHEVRVHHPQAPPERVVALDHLQVDPEDPASDIAAAVAERLKDRTGVVGIVCNSVPRAVEVSRLLAVALPSAEVTVLHARFTARDRARQTARVLRAAGKQGLDGREGRLRIIVATQVIEQSIDLDFDWLVTEAAPVDLTLQRAGRLHRWEQTPRPDWATSPVLTVCSPKSEVGHLPALSSTSFIYNKEMPGVLLSSWAMLTSRPQVRIPSDIPVMVEGVYGGAEPALSPESVEHWRSLLEVDRANANKGTKEAQNLILAEPWGTLNASWYGFKDGRTDEDGGRYRSRDGEESILVALAYDTPQGLRPVSSVGAVPLESDLEWRYSTLPVSASLLRAMGTLREVDEWEEGIMRGVDLHVLDATTSTLHYSHSEGLERFVME